MIFRKKPVEIEAVQFKRDSFEDIIKFTDGKATNFQTERCINGKSYCDINTLEGVMRAAEGDWIIKGVNGEFYPCKPDIFEKTYEPVDVNINSVKPTIEKEISADPGFEKGKTICIILYEGASKGEAEAFYGYVARNFWNGTPIPIKGTRLDLAIKNYNIYEVYEPTGLHIIYQVKVKGELV